jgi:hypothetical protein
MSKKIPWLNRTLVRGPYLILCTDEHEFKAVMKHIEYDRPYGHKWVSDGANATTHTLEIDDKTVCIVCLQTKPEVTGSDIASLLVHEAVHIFQRYCQSIGEDDPSMEFEAYSIQNICGELFDEFARRIERLKDEQRD